MQQLALFGGCEGCGALLTPLKARGNPKKWCSASCRVRIARDRRIASGDPIYYPRCKIYQADCMVCGELFCRKTGRTQVHTCSPQCTKALKATQQRARYASDPASMLAAQREARRLAPPEARAKYRATRKRWIEANRDVHNELVRSCASRRRARKLATQTEMIRHRDVYERDGWSCGICSRAVDPELTWPHPGSASLDHIEPLSLGGTHTWANVRLAHLNCNVRRGNRVEEVPDAG